MIYTMGADSEVVSFDDPDGKIHNSKIKEVKGRPDDFNSIIKGIASMINFKMVFFLFFIVLVVLSDVFVDTILSKYDDALEGGRVTSTGAIIQGIAICLGYMLLTVLDEGDII